MNQEIFTEAEKKEYFVVFYWDDGGWRSGSREKYHFIEAGSAKEALENAWILYEMDKYNYLDYSMYIYASPEAYHKHKKPLARKLSSVSVSGKGRQILTDVGGKIEIDEKEIA